MKVLLILYLGMMVNIFYLPSLQENSYSIVNDSIVVSNIRAQAMELNNRAILKKTKSFYQKDSLEEALALLEEASLIDTSYQLAYINLAQTQTEMGKVGEAIRTLKKTLRGTYNDRSLLFAIAYSYDLLEEPDSAQMYYKESLNAFRQCISVYPDSILLLANKAFVTSIMENDTTVISDLLKEYHRKYPNVDYLQLPIRTCTKKEFLKPLVLSEYRKNLQQEIEDRRSIKSNVLNHQ